MDASRAKVEVTPTQVWILGGVVLLLLVATLVGILRTNRAIDDARAAELRAQEAEQRAMNLENRVAALGKQVELLRLHVDNVTAH
jgi:hypothetical protein